MTECETNGHNKASVDVPQFDELVTYCTREGCDWDE